MSNIHVSVEQADKRDDAVKYKCVITTDGYYGTDVSQTPLGVWDNGTLKNYIGWPLESAWQSSWGQPDWRLSYGEWINSKFGGAYGTLINRRYEWTSDWISLPRGNQRKKSIDVTCGVRSVNPSWGLFPETLVTRKLETNEIPLQKFAPSKVNVTVDPANTSGQRYIRISAEFSNPDNYYTAKLYLNGNELAASSASPVTHNMPITKEMFQNSYTFEAKLWGKDGSLYDTISSNSNYVEPSGFGVWSRNNNNINEIDNLAFRNNKSKEITEVWVKVNGKIYQTRK